MVDATALLVEALYQLRSSIDALAYDQTQARESAISHDLALSLVKGLMDVRNSIDKLATEQAEFQRDIVSILTDISESVAQAPGAASKLDMMERDLSLIADRYRPFDDEGS